MCAEVHRHVQIFATLWTVPCQAPLSMGFSRQEYCSGLPCPPPGDLLHPGIMSLVSPSLADGFFTTSATWEAQENGTDALICRAEIETRCRDVENQCLDTKGIWDELGDWGSIHRSNRSPGGGHGNPLQYSCLESPMDRGAGQATVNGVTKSWIRLSD